MTRIAIVGGGLAGLTVAYRAMTAGHEVTVFEAGSRLGGQLSTARDDGWIVELGAEGFVARSEAVPRLAADLGMGSAGADAWSALLDQRATLSYRYDGSELRALAPGEAAEALSFQVARSDRGAGIRTFVGGMQSLTDALAAAVRTGTTVRLDSPVRALDADGPRVRVDGEAYDAVVLATSSAVAARLLLPVAGDATDTGVAELARAETLSSVTVSLAYDAGQVKHALDGTGFVVAEPFQGFRACTFTTSKFAHRAPAGAVSLRVFFRPTAAELEADTPWAARAVEVLSRVLPIEGDPRRSWVSIWPHALPVFTPELREAVARVERAIAPRSILLAGSAFHGSGIDAAVRSAEATASSVASGPSHASGS